MDTKKFTFKDIMLVVVGGLGFIIIILLIIFGAVFANKYKFNNTIINNSQFNTLNNTFNNTINNNTVYNLSLLSINTLYTNNLTLHSIFYNAIYYINYTDGYYIIRVINNSIVDNSKLFTNE